MNKALYFLPFIYLILCITCHSDSEDTSVYVIDNENFGISNNSSDPRPEATTKGINAAIFAAKELGYNKIKLKPGEYMIQSGSTNRWIFPVGGIKVPSNTTLDLTDVIIRLEPNDHQYYGMIQLEQAKNVTITGGHLIGDRYQHSYINSDELTHEYGYGVNLMGASNITVRNMKIEGMTGDAVILTSYNHNSVEENRQQRCKNIIITECELFDCRRQGISIVNAIDSEISHNKIHNIHGTDPQFGIDMEPEVNYGCIAERIQIHHNYISNCIGGISFHGGTDSEAYENTIEGLCLIAVYSQRIRIYKNTVTSPGYISAGKGSSSRPCTDICIATEGGLKNHCNTIVNLSIQTGNFHCR